MNISKKKKKKAEKIKKGLEGSMYVYKSTYGFKAQKKYKDAYIFFLRFISVKEVERQREKLVKIGHD